MTDKSRIAARIRALQAQRKGQKVTHVSTQVSCLKRMATGEPQKKRFRVLWRLFRKPALVLQVQDCVAVKGAIKPMSRTKNIWRDVRPEEILDGDVKC